MPEIRTTECSEVGHPELVVRFTNPDDEPYARRWVDSLIERVWDGQTLRAGDRVRLDGWLVELVSDGDVLALHADDLAADAPSFKPGVDTGLPWIAQQRDLAESYGSTFTSIDARLATLEICPEAHEGLHLAAMLARSEPAALAASGYERIAGIHESGWYVGCDYPDCRGRGPRGKWHTIHIHELLRRRPDLVPYLALPPGAAVEASTVGSRRVGRQPADVNLDPEWNPLRISREPDPTTPLLCRFAMFYEVQWAELPETSRWYARMNRVSALVLDPIHDPELCHGYYPLAEIMKRHRVNQPTAESALRDAMRPERWDEWLGTRHRDVFPPGIFERVRRELDAQEPERWRLHHAIARSLIAETQRPFADLKAVIEALDRELGQFKACAAKVARPD